MARHFRLRDQLAILAVLPLLVATVAAVVLVADSSNGARPIGLLIFGALVLVAPICVFIIRSVEASIDEMANRVEVMTNAHRRRSTTAPADGLSPIEVGNATGALGRLAGAVNELHTAAVEAGKDQNEAVRDGLSGIVVNLARRNQTLIDRQIEQLDQLEQTEEDPNRLGHLFKIDHLATRMRRNAESLLVLADADPGHRRGEPVEVSDVLRVAMGEVEMFQKVDLARVDQALLPPAAAVDLAHLAAELMENATQFSPPTSPVVVTGTDDGSNRYIVVVSDDGMGMSPAQLAAANRTLTEPPELNLDMGRSLGFMVIGRLARRLGATVTLSANGDAGCRAVVSIPKHVLVEPKQVDIDRADPVAAVPSLFEQTGPDMGDSTDAIGSTSDGLTPSVEQVRDRPLPPAPQIATARQIPAPPRPPIPVSPAVVPSAGPTNDETPQPVEPETFAWPAPQPGGQVSETMAINDWPPPNVASPPERLEQALPTGPAFDDGMAALLKPRRSTPGSTAPRGPLAAGETPAGLVRRKRSSTGTNDGGGSAQPAKPESRPVAVNRRDPEEIRQRLSRYRQGLKGQHPSGQTTPRPQHRPSDPIPGDQQ